MIKIAIDAMGGDNAPEAIVSGVNMALKTYEDIEVLLFGDQDQVEQYLKVNDRVKVFHTTEVVTGDDDPVRAVRRKKDSSMIRAAQAVKDGEADVLLSAGNTGALLTAGLLVVGRIKGVERPGLMPVIPTINPDSPHFILMDAGANADTKPNYLLQYAVLANYYAQNVLDIPKPRIGLINNGTEAGKGDELRKEAFDLLKGEETLHFIGNIETKDLLNGIVDIAITDGFTGNAVLKTLEGAAKNIFKLLKETLTESGLKTKIGALLVKDALGDLALNFDDTKQGGAVLLGVQKAVIKAHGSSNDAAIFNAIRQARKVVESQAIEKIKNYYA